MERKDDVIDMVNGKPYSDDTAFFGIVDANAKRAEETARVNDYFATTERAVAASIKGGVKGVKDVKAEHHRFIKERADRLRKLTILKLIALITAGVIVIGGAVYIGNEIAEDIKVSMATAHEVENAREKLKWLIIEKIGENGSVAFSNEEDLVANRSSVLDKDDFEKLNLNDNDIGDIYALMVALGEDKDAIDALASSIGDSSNPYKSIDDFCDRTGLDFNSFKKSAEEEMYKNYLANKLNNNTNSSEKAKGGK